MGWLVKFTSPQPASKTVGWSAATFRQPQITADHGQPKIGQPPTLINWLGLGVGLGFVGQG